jgi:hypothetical protein
VRLRVIACPQRFDGGQLRDVNAFLFAHNDVVAAAIDRRAWLNADKTITTGFGWMRLNFEAAHNSPPMQLLLVMTQFLHVKTGFIGKVALDQELPGKIVVPRERTIITHLATVLRYCVVCMSHNLPL